MSKIKTLVISSDPVMQEFLQRNLDDGNYQLISTERTGGELRSVLDTELPDIVILDIMMPYLEGIETCLRLRQWSLVPIIMLSAWGVENGKVRALNLSADTYLTKPFGIDGVKTRIEEAIKRNLDAISNMPTIHSRIPLEK